MCEGVAWSVKRVVVTMMIPPKHHPDVRSMVILCRLKLEVGVGHPGLEGAAELTRHELLAAELVGPGGQAKYGYCW